MPVSGRKKTRAVFVGGVQVGGGAPVAVQSMTSTDTRDIRATVGQIRRLEKAGCEIVRVAIPDLQAADAVAAIRKKTSIPVIADIHFDYRLALAAIRAGADGIRVNPGNIARDRMRIIAAAARDNGTAVRLGVNAGSLERDIRKKSGGAGAAALVESAMRGIALLESSGVTSLKLSLKSSDVPTMIEAYREISLRTDYPLHLGVTEAGTFMQSCIKSSLGIGSLLHDGIGDTIRVSITGDPVREIRVAYGILGALGIRSMGPEIVSCPTCGRCEIDLSRLVNKVEKKLAGSRKHVKIALMGCVVNGPGEAADADIGIAGGRGAGVLFRKGKPVRKVREEDFLEVLMHEIENW
jgi:(E)-4-hydroxy-3-methylbut-2-enyl-diphosphate synthase